MQKKRLRIKDKKIKEILEKEERKNARKNFVELLRRATKNTALLA